VQNTDFDFRECGVPETYIEGYFECEDPPPPPPPEPVLSITPYFDCPSRYAIKKNNKNWEVWSMNHNGVVIEVGICENGDSYTVRGDFFGSTGELAYYVQNIGGTCGTDVIYPYSKSINGMTLVYKTTQSVTCPDRTQSGCTQYCSDTTLCIIVDDKNRTVKYINDVITWKSNENVVGSDFDYYDCNEKSTIEGYLNCEDPPPPPPPEPVLSITPYVECPARYSINKNGKIWEVWSMNRDGVVIEKGLSDNGDSYAIRGDDSIIPGVARYIDLIGGACSYYMINSYSESINGMTLVYKTTQSANCPDSTQSGCTQYCSDTLCIIVDDKNRTVKRGNDVITWKSNENVTEDDFKYYNCYEGNWYEGYDICRHYFTPEELGDSIHLSANASSGGFSVNVDLHQMVDKKSVVRVKAVTNMKSGSDDISVTSVSHGDRKKGNESLTITVYGEECKESYSDFFVKMEVFEYDTEKEIECPDGSKGCRELCYSSTCVTVDKNDRYVVTRLGTVITYFDDGASADMFNLRSCSKEEEKQSSEENILSSASLVVPSLFLLVLAVVFLL